MQSNSSNNAHVRGTHGGRREGSGRKKKEKEVEINHTHTASKLPSGSTSSSVHQAQALNTPLFFAPRVPQGTLRPKPSTHGDVGNPSVSPSHSITGENYRRLINEVEEVMDNDEYADIRIENGREVDESISDDIDDSMEKNTRIAEQETIASELPECSVIHQHLVDYRNSLRKQLEQYGMPKCYKDRQFIVHPPHPVFVLHDAATRTAFNPDMLCLRPIFVWLPEYLPGRPDRFECRCGGNLTMNGYNDNPIARRVHTSSGVDYFLFTNRYICDARRRNNPGCGTSYQGSDPHILDQLPRWVQEAFPAYLTARGAVDKLVIDQMKPCFAGRFGPEPFSKMLHELQMLQHSRREVMYLSAAATFGLSGSQVPRFPSFDDRMSYAGNSPSVWYLKCIWTDYHAAVKIYHDRIQASLSGYKLAGDHTFRIMKAMARLKSEPIFSALFSLVNEWEEIRAQAMGLTKGFSVLPEMFEQVKQGLEEHGHQPTNIYYYAPAERDFHERVTKSLTDNVVHIPRTGPATVDDMVRYPNFKLDPAAVIEFYNDFMLINNACESVLEQVEALASTDTLIVALSISKTVQKTLHSIQLRTSDKIFVFEISSLMPTKVPPCLRSILTFSHIIKIGHSIVDSILCIAAALDLPDVESIASRNGRFLDLGQIAKVKGVVQDAYASLDSLVCAVLKKTLPEIPNISLPAPVIGSTHWSRSSALHIDVMWQIYLSLIQSRSVGLRLHPSETQIGQLVTLVAACKEVAEGVILDHDGTVEGVMDEQGTTAQLKITPAYSLVQINKVFVPGSILAKHKQTMQWIFEHGQKAVVQTRTLRSRSAIPPLPIDSSSSSILGIPASAPSANSESILTIGPSQRLLDQSLPVSDGNDSESEEDPSSTDDNEDGTGDEDNSEDYPGDDDDIDRDLDDDEPELTSEELIQRESTDSYASRVFDDSFHFMDRLLRTLPKKHSAFREFAHQFSETIFVRDGDDIQAVKIILERKGMSWDFVLRAKKAWLNCHVRRYIPPPAKLETDLRCLFDGFKNIVCSSDRKKRRGRFFSKESLQVSNTLLETVHCGFLSDPSNIPLYYIIGWDRDKLPLYRTIRGTNSIEGGVHMLIRRIFGSLRASPELAVSLLSNWVLRRNQRIGHFNRTGKRWSNHFDIWLLDEITELTIFLNTSPSFRLPRMLATRIATSESFGIIPIPSALADKYQINTLPARRVTSLPHHRDTPVHLLTRLSTKITNPYRYLQLTQRTIFPVIPVHTRKEYTEFRRLVGSDNIRNNHSNVPVNQAWKGINYVKFAMLWNVLVSAQDATLTDPNDRLYYKLPEQLLRHHKKVLEWQASRATMLDGSNAAMIQDHTSLLQDPKWIAYVLPAVQLEDLDAQPDPTANGIRGLDLSSFNSMALIQHDLSGHVYSDAQFSGSSNNTSDLTSRKLNTAIEHDISHNAAAVAATTSAEIQTINSKDDDQHGTVLTQMTLTFFCPNDLEQPPAKKQRLENKARAARECAVCSFYQCPRAPTCNGKGGRQRCYAGICNHENIGKARVHR
ncbi:hypothetical protein EV360DRAFT_88655 [Lentinula raphanica]|nr:hypothetical protein EV360DRAFT_88655 [Lentinula raphanica]